MDVAKEEEEKETAMWSKYQAETECAGAQPNVVGVIHENVNFAKRLYLLNIP